MKKRFSALFAVGSALLAGCAGKNAASIGIIGGADGPTAVFIATKINWPQIATAALAVATVLYFCFKRKK